MALLKIIKYPNSILRTKCRLIPEITDEIKKLARDMVETMHENEGIGLAGPQVGKELEIIMIDVGKGPLVLANPKVLARSGTSRLEEGCLSLPGVYLEIRRSSRVEVEGIRPEDGKKVRLIATGIAAHALQHELDHLEGVLIIDKVPFWKKWLVLEKLKKRD